MSQTKEELSPTNSSKLHIIARTVEEDKLAVAEQWLNTFRYSKRDSDETNIAAIKIAELMFAAISVGDFKTKSSLVSPQLMAPPTTLSVVDYISHASRIVIDYKSLSSENLEKFLQFFPNAGDKGVISRSATHAVTREGAITKEVKGFMLGVYGQFPSMVKTPCDFGINIAMGGNGQKNFIGNTISANGFSGHIYFHHNATDSLLMVGLEQSAPAASILEAILGHKHSGGGVQEGTDQFGQSHSLTGASDRFTAAGSLYFSDPIYKAKLLAETKSFPPDKYGGMKITLTNENWSEIMNFLADLDKKIEAGSETDIALVRQQLLAYPKSATDKPEIDSYIAIDFKEYIRGIAVLLEEVSKENRSQLQNQLTELQNNLLTDIQFLQQGNVETHDQFKNISGRITDLIKNITELDFIPACYTKAIQRIQTLVNLECDNHLKLQTKHSERLKIDRLIEQRSSELLEEITELEKKVEFFQEQLGSFKSSSEYIKRNDEIGRIKQALNKESIPIKIVSANDGEAGIYNDSFVPIGQARREQSYWLEVPRISLEYVGESQDKIRSFSEWINSELKRYLSDKLDELNVPNEKLLFEKEKQQFEKEKQQFEKERQQFEKERQQFEKERQQFEKEKQQFEKEKIEESKLKPSGSVNPNESVGVFSWFRSSLGI